LGGRKSPVPVIIKTAQGEEVLYGINEFKTRLRALIADSKRIAARFSGVSEQRLTTLVEQIDQETSWIKRSQSQQVILDSGVTLGRIKSLESVRNEALARYDRDMGIEQLNTLTSVADDIFCVVTTYVSGGITVGSSRACTLVSGIVTLVEVVSMGYQTGAREQVDQLPFEMLLSLPGEAGSLWSNIRDVSARIMSVALEHDINPCDLFTAGYTIPQGFGVPWNVFNPIELVLQTFCSATGVTAQIQKPSSIQYHYTYIQGHQWNSNISQWTPFTYQCDSQVLSGAWCTTDASASLNPAYPYFIAFTCSWINDTWKCGCRDQTCTTGYWQLQQFQR
jgi:hypothetical protein